MSVVVLALGQYRLHKASQPLIFAARNQPLPFFFRIFLTIAMKGTFVVICVREFSCHRNCPSLRNGSFPASSRIYDKCFLLQQKIGS